MSRETVSFIIQARKLLFRTNAEAGSPLAQMQSGIVPGKPGLLLMECLCPPTCTQPIDRLKFNPRCDAMVFGGRALGKSCGLDGGAFMSGISASVRRGQRAS